ncbi:menaquinone-dependent protoporphyrinogen IX oxidase [Ruminiclostridium sufflavum DSM 19573]|uniref:Menaquinone-dependent protoporphyrinogen IX oxidase n=1 Tax=Ruminiclostridium sufflavum DSM 19573 TaxID=1121337 RepID=A0A318XTE3_9FIRM|nr:flavodoxin domain-containing protein [Ruminiclostridium sufflavum]PYG89952.1 menaquinone-dependent protoporphyrinogen IX oxidase [Ruminiclostridium sufflavum DSM 19573]
MERTLILYESRYGLTERISKGLSLILGPAKYCRPLEFNGSFNNFGTIVICTPVYLESVDENIYKYVLKNADLIKQKKVILICSCLAEDMAGKYLKPLKDILGQSVILETSLGGELIPDKLNSQDYELIKKFSAAAGFPLKDRKSFEMKKLVKLALDIRRLKDKELKLVPEEELKTYISNFIKKHNSCALATGYDDAVRNTPMEYMYIDDCIYIFSEGGEKFSNLLLNPKVSITIYDAYRGMNKLGGIQISGVSEIIDTGCDEYIYAFKQRGLNIEKIVSLPVALNLIKINISKVEFLWSGFVELGYDIKQVLYV